MFDDQPHGRRGGQGSPLCRVQVAPVQLPVHPELQERTGFFDGGPQAVRVVARHVAGIGSGG